MEQDKKANEIVPSNGTANNQNKKKYSTPKIHRHGGLAELVQFRPGRGADGEAMWSDCTAS
jgi:hypothetical protein